MDLSTITIDDLIETCADCGGEGHTKEKDHGARIDLQRGQTRLGATTESTHEEVPFGGIRVCGTCKGDKWIPKEGPGKLLLEFIQKTKNQSQTDPNPKP